MAGPPRLVVADNDSATTPWRSIEQSAPEVATVETGRNAGYAAAINYALDEIEEALPDVRP